MPFINTKTTAFIGEAAKESLAKAYCKIARECLGKGEAWVMCGFEPEASISFRGEMDNAAYIEVKAYGKLSAEGTDKMTAQVTDLIEDELGIPADRCYVAYFPVEMWGWSGSNF